MSKYYFHKPVKRILITIMAVRFLGICLFVIGITTVFYVFSPLIIWQFTLAPAFADSQITSPVPQRNVLTPSILKSLVANSLQHLSGVDYTDASNWFPS